MWSWLVEACTLAYIVLLIICFTANLPLWTFLFFPAFMILGAYAEHRADSAHALHGAHPRS